MAEMVTRQELIDAKRDARDLGKAVNEKVIVSPRYGEDFKSLPMIAAEFQISSDAAEAAAVSATESADIAQSSANIAEAAATAATIGAGVFETPEAGVDPVTGVVDGAYFNVRSSSDESYVDEYQNVGGVPTPSGKSYPSAAYVQSVAEHTALPFVDGKAYSLNERVQLDNGYIVKSITSNNLNNPNQDLTGWSFDEQYVTPEQYGAGGKGLTDDILALEKAHDSLKEGQILLCQGKYAVSREWLFTKKYVSLDLCGMLTPHGNSYSDYLFRTDYDYTAGANNQERGDIAGVVDIISLNIDCEFKSRGSYLYRIDCSTLDKVRVYRSYGTAIWSNRFRESSIIAPKVIGAKRRLRFDNPIFWSSSTAYTVGQRVRIGYSNYSNTTTYARYANVLGSDGNRYVSLSASNVGNDPVTSVGVWKRLPFIDYECLIAHTNKDPEQGFNSNSSTVANRFWRRAHQDEAVVEIVDEGNPNIDRQNQLVIDGADIRDWNNLCGVRIDNIKSNHPITHVKILNSHLHAVQWSVINNYANSGRAGEIVPEDIPEMMRVLEIGRTQNTYIFGNLRIPDSKDSIGVLIGDGNNKLTQSCNIGGVMSGSGDKQMGVYVGNSIIQGRSDLDLRYLLEGNDTIDLFDPAGFFILQRDTPIQATIGKYRNGAPTAILAEIDPSYGQSYGVQVRKIGDTQPRVALEMGATTAGIRFGNGADSTDTRIYRDGAGVIRVDDANKFRIRGSWQYPFIMNNNRLWVDDIGLLRIKRTDPSSDTDGAVVGTQT